MIADESKFDYEYVPEHLKERAADWSGLSFGEGLELAHELSIAAWERLGVIYDPDRPMDKTIRRLDRSSR